MEGQVPAVSTYLAHLYLTHAVTVYRTLHQHTHMHIQKMKCTCTVWAILQHTHAHTGWAKKTDLRSHNFATTDDRKACNMSKVSTFCLE